jgi:hypothetical protein
VVASLCGIQNIFEPTEDHVILTYRVFDSLATFRKKCEAQNNLVLKC